MGSGGGEWRCVEWRWGVELCRVKVGVEVCRVEVGSKGVW